MNSSNVTGPPPPVGSDGWNALWQYIAYMIEGITIGGSNLFIVVVILRFNALRTAKEYMIVAGLSLADACYLIGYLLAGARRTRLVLTGGHSGFITPWECTTAPQTIIWLFSEHLSALMLLIVSCDRLFAVLIPETYICWETTYGLTIVGGAFAYTFGTAGLLAFKIYHGLQDQLVPAACFISSTMKVAKLSDIYISYYKYATPVFTVTSILLYGIVWVVYMKKSAQVISQQSTLNTQQTARVARQRKLTKVLGISCLCTIFVYLIPYTCAKKTTGILDNNYRIIFYLVANMNSFCNLFIYAFRHEDMKDAIRALLSRKTMPDNLDMWKTNRERNTQHTGNA